MEYKEKTLEILYNQMKALETDFQKQTDVQLKLKISDQIGRLARVILF